MRPPPPSTAGPPGAETVRPPPRSHGRAAPRDRRWTAGSPPRSPLPPSSPPRSGTARGRPGGWRPRILPPERGAGARPAPPPQPPAPTGTAGNKRACADAPGRRTDRAQCRRASTNRSGMGGHTPHGQNDAIDTRFLACPGKAEGRNEAERPPALQAPPGRTNGGHGARAAPPPPPSPPPGTRAPRTCPTGEAQPQAR